MRVKLRNKNLWAEYFSVLSGISVVTSFIFLFLKIPEDQSVDYFIGFVIFLALVFLVVWYRANTIKNIKLNINNSTLEIGPGDIFTENGFKIIAFNEYFDTQVDDMVISRNTANGKYITRFYSQPSELDSQISNDAHATQQIVGEMRRDLGKAVKYKLGTIVKNGDYFLLAFTHFDENNRAFIEISDYIDCLMNMWNECDIHYGGHTVALPLLGSGITRFRGSENITDQELLETLIWTFKMSRIRFQYPERVKIVLTDACLHKVNLYDIVKHYE